MAKIAQDIMRGLMNAKVGGQRPTVRPGMGRTAGGRGQGLGQLSRLAGPLSSALRKKR